MSQIQKFEGENLTIKEEVIKLHFETRKFKDFQNKDWDILAEQISQLAALIGIKNIEPEEINFIIEYLKRSNDLSYWEFTKALQLNMDRKLPEYTEHYGAITNYIGGVIAQYRRFRAKYLAQHQQKEPELTEQEKTELEEKKKEEHNEIMLDILKELDQNFRNGTYLFSEDIGVKYYNCLKYFGLMPEFKDKERYQKARLKLISKYERSFDKDEQRRVKFLKGEEHDLAQHTQNIVTNQVLNVYRGYLVERVLLEAKDAFDTLYEYKEWKEN
jgi:hypothetical protein